MANHVKNQHCVPQFLLRNFCSTNENKIWCYDLLWKRSEERSIKTVAKEEYFYDVIHGERNQSLEYLLSKVETDAAPIIKNIIESKDIRTITTEEKAVLAIFIVLQSNRTQSALKQTERAIRSYWDPIENFAREMNAKLDFSEPNPKELWFHTMAVDTPAFCEIIGKKRWFLLISDENFYASDNPFVRQNIVNSSPVRGTLGFDSHGIEMYFPLNPSIMLCLFCEKEPLFSMFDEGYTFVCPSETIENLNSLQVIQAERFVFSSKDDFGLVEDMLNTLNPET